MAKKIYILLFAVIGLLMGPQSAMARPVEAPMVCCEKMLSEIPSKKSCCKAKSEESTKKQHCKGGCSSCSCATNTVDVKTPLFANVTDADGFFDFSEKKQKYFYLEALYANDARSIWLPPKIS